jgi:transposase IS66 family protein
VPAERTASLTRMLLGMPVSPGFVHGASDRLNARLEDAGFDRPMQAALEKEPVLAADETPVNLLDPHAGLAEDKAGAPHVLVVRTPQRGLTWLRALGSRQHAAITAVLSLLHRVLDQRRVLRLPGTPAQAGRDPAVLPAHHPPLPRRHRARPRQPAVLGGDVIDVLREAHQTAEDALAGGDPALDAELLAKLHQRYDEAVAFGITHNRHRDWHDGNRPGYVLGCWLQQYADQVWLFTHEPCVEWTNNCSEQAVKAAKRHQAVSGYWHAPRTLARWCRIRSYLDTAASHGLTALGAITRALAGDPWLSRPSQLNRPTGTTAHRVPLNGHPDCTADRLLSPHIHTLLPCAENTLFGAA